MRRKNKVKKIPFVMKGILNLKNGEDYAILEAK